ncbi:MAG: tetratricopeptide repeat protein [Blautia sp.]|nr:tetratricopeptide repeat protein [Blautia sp.]
MICYRCGHEVAKEERCPSCGAELSVFHRVIRISNAYYNQGLERAAVRNLSGAVESLKKCLKFNKNHMDARNLLGLVYYEMGETVDALSEWVISRSYKPEENVANRYLDAIQLNRGELNNINQAIKKYNLALHYCEQGSRDLAVIQLKKVLSMNPRLIRGHQLLALLYLQDNKPELAKKTLRNAGKIDANNTLTLRYLKEVNLRLKEKGNLKKQKDDDLISYQSGNETIIMPKRFKESSLGSTLLSIVIGLVVGTAVTAWLIVPGVRDRANAEAQQKLIDASDIMSTNGQTIKELEAQVEELEGQLLEQQQSKEQSADQIKAYERLLKAYSTYSSGDAVGAGTLLEKVDTSLLSKSAKNTYKDLNALVQVQYLQILYDEGYSAYTSGNYEEAVEKLQKVVDEDEDYGAGNAAYYLAQAYRISGNLEAARPYYQYVLDHYPGSNRARTARNYVDARE